MDGPGSMRATLFEVALHTPDPDRIAKFYTRAFGYRFARDDRGLLGVAMGRRLRLAEGAAKTLAHAVFAVDDAESLTALCERLDRMSVVRSSGAVPGLTGDPVHFTDCDGNRFIFGLAEADATAAFDGATAMRPARLQHIVFGSRHAERLLSFYQDVMGFSLSDRVVDGNGGLRTAFLRCSHEHHSLALFNASEDGLDHHCFEAGDWGLIRDWGDHLAAEHIPIQWGPGRHGPGNNLFIFIHDPDGNWLEISAELERVEQDRKVGEWPHEERTLNVWGAGFLRS